MPYHTPDSAPDDVSIRRISIPDTAQWRAIVNGALLEMTYPHNWEQYGTLTPDEAAERALIMYLALQEDEAIVTLGTMAYQNADNVDIDGGTIDGTVIGATAKAAIDGTLIRSNDRFVVDTPTPVARQYQWRTNGLTRFSLLVTGEAESGSNVGSNFVFNRYNDAGAVIDGVFSVTRSTGLLIALKDLQAQGKFQHNGASLGFFATAAIAKPTVTGSRGGNAALASALTQLANLGLIVNNTTA